MGSAPVTIPVTSAGIFRCAFVPGSEELPFVLGDAADAVEMVLTHGLTAVQRKFHAPAWADERFAATCCATGGRGPKVAPWLAD
jgi:hypothetical protein